MVMSKIKALIVGVSDYSTLGEKQLPFCVNDIYAVSDALQKGLNVEGTNIITCGETGSVSVVDFLQSFKNAILDIDEEDTFIFYFSGHGGNSNTEHFILLSDGFVKTQEVIQLLEKLRTKNKVIILDSCKAGNFTVRDAPSLSEKISIDDFVSRGYAVWASCNETQYSYGHPSRPISLFTYFLCEAIRDKYIIRQGRKSLIDIQRLLLLYLSIWNKNNPGKVQNPIFRASLCGTIYFTVEDYIPYQIKTFYEETEKYVIYSVKPLHNVTVKKYAVSIIIKEPFTFKEIAQIKHEIIEKIKYLDIYNNSQSENRWLGHPTNIIFGYFGRDEEDIINANYICMTTWVDDNQNKDNWYKKGENCEIIKNIHFKLFPYYNYMKCFNQENTGEIRVLYDTTKKIVNSLVSLAEQVISLYNEFLNKTIDEKELIQQMDLIIPSISKWYFAENDLDLSPKDLKMWSQSCSCLIATIHDFTLFYNSHYINSRTYENRMACMDLVIKRYYEDLEKVLEAEKDLKLKHII